MLAQMMGAAPPVGPFNTQYRCYSAMFFAGATEEKLTEIERGGKILLPSSSLDWLTRLNIAYPMLFRLTNPRPETQRVTHCGVLEFLADEGKCYLPHWMMRHLLLDEGSVVQIEYANLPNATYAKFKPMSTDFLDISCPKSVLEMKLRSFACLTKGDLIAIEYLNKIFEISVVETKPGNAVSIVECDLNVEFDAPEGYVEPKKEQLDRPGSSQDSTTLMIGLTFYADVILMGRGRHQIFLRVSHAILSCTFPRIFSRAMSV